MSKYENKFAKLQKKAAEFNIRNQLKTVKKKEFSMDDADGVCLAVKMFIAKSVKRMGFFVRFCRKRKGASPQPERIWDMFAMFQLTLHYIKRFLLYYL